MIKEYGRDTHALRCHQRIVSSLGQKCGVFVVEEEVNLRTAAWKI